MTTLGTTGRNLLIASMLTLAAIAPATASGQACNDTAPTDNAQVDEYSESIPGACGNEPTSQHTERGDTAGGGGSTGGSGPGSSISTDTADELQSLGSDGAAAAALAEATAPPSDGSSNRGGASSGDEASDDGGSGSVLSGVQNAVSGDSSDGMGILLPLLLGVVLLAGVAYVVRRRTGTTHA
jgi:hypothetical protein